MTCWLDDNAHLLLNSTLRLRCLLLLSALTFSVKQIHFPRSGKRVVTEAAFSWKKEYTVFDSRKASWSCLYPVHKRRKQYIILGHKICRAQLMGSYLHSSLSRSPQQWFKILYMMSIVSCSVQFFFLSSADEGVFSLWIHEHINEV